MILYIPEHSGLYTTMNLLGLRCLLKMLKLLSPKLAQSALRSFDLFFLLQEIFKTF